jgi:hypothetical protein
MATQRELVVPEVEANPRAAEQQFRERVKQLPEALRVEEHEDMTTGLPSFRIYVRQGDREAQHAVYELEAELYQRYPGASLDVQVLVDTVGRCPDSSSQANAR